MSTGVVWDDFLAAVFHHWEGASWPDNASTTAAFASELKMGYTPAQQFSSFLNDLSFTYGTNQEIQTSSLDNFAFDTNSHLREQTLTFMRHYRQHHNEPEAGPTTRRLKQIFSKKVKTSPFRKAWDRAMVFFPDGLNRDEDLMSVVSIVESSPDYPSIHALADNRAPGGIRLKTLLSKMGKEYKQTEKDVQDKGECLICMKNDHTTFQCKTLVDFHNRHGWLAKQLDWGNFSKVCPVHGACSHEGRNCSIISSLRKNPKLQIRKRERAPDKDHRQENAEKRDYKRRRSLLEKAKNIDMNALEEFIQLNR